MKIDCLSLLFLDHARIGLSCSVNLSILKQIFFLQNALELALNLLTTFNPLWTLLDNFNEYRHEVISKELGPLPYSPPLIQYRLPI